MRGHLKCHVLCICYVPCYWQLPVLVFSSLPNIFRESLIRYLMPFLAFIGRTFAVWLRRLIVIQLPFHRSCWRTSSPHFRSTASTRKSYATAQSQFLSFCRQLGRIHSSGSPFPADDWTLCLFATFLAGSLQHSSIKVYLSGVRALHI